jgi:hypothetical protein
MCRRTSTTSIRARVAGRNRVSNLVAARIPSNTAPSSTAPGLKFRRRTRWTLPVLVGRGARRLAATDPRNQGERKRRLLSDQANGTNCSSCVRTESVQGFQTGDMLRAEVPTGKKAGTHVGRVAVRGSGSFRVGNTEGINAKYCKLLHRADGDCYAWQPALPPRPEERDLQRGRL